MGFLLDYKAGFEALIINLAVAAVWYALEFQQFGTLQWGRSCDNVVGMIYFFIIWWFAHENNKWIKCTINIFEEKEDKQNNNNDKELDY